MSAWEQLKQSVSGPIADAWSRIFGGWRVKCSLCGSKESRPVTGQVSAADALGELVKNRTWLESQGVSGVPDIDQGRLQELPFPGFEEGDRNSPYHRCKSCSALLTKPFWNPLPNGDFGLTVAGAAEHGKTTWLLSALTPLGSDVYELVRSCQEVQASTDQYVEPLDLALLATHIRTAIPYYLLGSTVVKDGRELAVRTLDIKGERFKRESAHQTQRVIKRHLGAKSRRGALLIIDRFYDRFGTEKPPARADYLAQAFGDINIALRWQQDVWKGIVWTFLDKAKWHPKAGSWLTAQLNDPRLSDRLVALASGPNPSPSEESSNTEILREDVLTSLVVAVRRRPPQQEEIYGLVRLLFSLQLLYCCVATRSPEGKYAYYERHGKPIVKHCRTLARELYRWWDIDRHGAMSNFVMSGGWDVLPCGRVDLPGATQTDGKPQQASVWSDQILLHAFGE